MTISMAVSVLEMAGQSPHALAVDSCAGLATHTDPRAVGRLPGTQAGKRPSHRTCWSGPAEAPFPELGLGQGHQQRRWYTHG